MRSSPLVAMAASVIIAACTTLVSDPPEGTGGRGTGGGATDRIDCPAGTADCGDGDCIPLDSEEHCGACDVECTAHNGAAACVAGACQITCDPGFADCNGDPRDGCEVGLLTEDPNDVLPDGAYAVRQVKDKPPMEMIGQVTSSYRSPTLGRSIAMALIENGRSRMGETISFPLPGGKTVRARITELEGAQDRLLDRWSAS